MVAVIDPVVSVIVATYNASAFIDQTLESLREQDGLGSEVEIVVVDGASTDDTVERVLRSGLPLVLRSQPDEGIYDAMNIGVEMASGRWVQFLNAGDVFHGPGSLGSVLGVLRGNDDADWLVAGAQNMQGGRGPAVRIPNLPYRRLPHLLGLQPHCHQSCWFRRDTFRELGGHRADMGIVADFDLIARFASVGRPSEFLPVVIDYLGGGVSEVPARLIAARLHEARVRRFQLGWLGRTVDLLAARALGLLNGLRVTLGRMRRSSLRSGK